MLRRHVSLRQICSSRAWRARGVSTETEASQSLRSEEWLQADEAITKSILARRKQWEQQNHNRLIAPHNVRRGDVEQASDRASMGGQSSKIARARAPAKRFLTPRKSARSLKPLATKTVPSLHRRAAKGLAHNDLASYLRHAAKAKLDLTTAVHKGVLYEYIVLKALKAYNFDLTRKGQAGDRGRDLDGVWKVPGSTPRKLLDIPVIVQCKAYKPQPSQVRELEGSNASVPAGMHNGDVLRLLVAKGKGTKGVIDAVGDSKVPMGFVHINGDGLVEQITWNEPAKQMGLEGIEPTLRWSSAPVRKTKRETVTIALNGKDKSEKGSSKGPVVGTVVLMVRRKVWRPRPRKPTTSSRA